MQIRILTPKSTSFLRLHQALLAIESGVSIHMKLSYNMVYQKAYPYLTTLSFTKSLPLVLR